MPLLAVEMFGKGSLSGHHRNKSSANAVPAQPDAPTAVLYAECGLHAAQSLSPLGDPHESATTGARSLGGRVETWNHRF